MAPLPAFVLAGAAIGSLTGLFGVGGSAIATPLLSLLGVPPLIAVASPLPATVPAGALSGRFAHGVEGPRVRRAFGWFLTASGVAFVALRLLFA